MERGHLFPIAEPFMDVDEIDGLGEIGIPILGGAIMYSEAIIFGI
jgi:hypothetical protein